MTTTTTTMMMMLTEHCPPNFSPQTLPFSLAIASTQKIFVRPSDSYAVDWLSLSKRNFKLDLGDVLLFKSVGLRHMITGVPDPWLSTLSEGLYTGVRATEGWPVVALTVSSSSRTSPSPAALLKLLVLEEDLEMLARPLQSFSLMNGLSLFGQISGELGFEDGSDLTSCDR